MSEHLPAQIDALWRGDFYNVMDGEFAMHSASPFNTAILTMGKKKNRKSVFIKLNDLRYLAYIFPMVENQLLKYSEAKPDVMNYVLATLNSTSSVEPPADASNNILYYQLHEELKTCYLERSRCTIAAESVDNVHRPFRQMILYLASVLEL